MSKTMHAQIGRKRALERCLVGSGAVIAPPGPAAYGQKTLMFQDPSGLLYGYDADAKQLGDFCQRTDLSAWLAREDQVAQHGSGCRY
jgi:hypothetical protein